jgi:serine/threonine-protein kinase Chk2
VCVISRGNFAAVKLCIKRATGEKFALKVIDKKKYVKNAGNRKDALMDEVNILKVPFFSLFFCSDLLGPFFFFPFQQSVSHDNIIRIFEVYDTEKTLFIVLELCGTSPFSFVFLFFA